VSEELGNSRVLHPLPGVAIACMLPMARKALDAAVAAWERDHPGKDIHAHNADGFSPYRTLYWLYRWSDCIQFPEQP
jgi:hypothetical protein